MSIDLEIYRADAKAWLETKAMEFGRAARRGLSEEKDLTLGRRWQAEKFAAGYSAINWSKEHGGQGLGALEKLAFEQEEMKHSFPNDYFGVSLGMPVPIMLRYVKGDWARERATKALKGEEIWCQLFSEPAAGSDLAGLRTRADRDDATGDWIINGQKLWTTWAQYADYGVIVARSDPTVAKHRGLTYFWVDMKSPGVTVRPVRLAEGRSEVNEVFFDDVRIADSQRLGSVGGGFGVAMETLMIERYQATDPAGFGPPIDLFVEEAKTIRIGGKSAIQDGRVRERIARTYAAQSALAAIHRRALLSLAAGMQPGPEGSVHKLVSVRTRQKLSEFAMDLKGVDGMRYDEDKTRKESWLHKD